MPTSTRATSDRARAVVRGFTLIEVALVLLIVSILLSFLAPRLLELTHVRRETSAHRLAAVLGYLHDEASLRGRSYRLTIDLDRSTYEVRMVPAEDDDVENVPDETLPLARDRVLPEGVRVDSIETPAAFATSGSVDLFFHPESDGASARVALIDDTGDRSIVAFDGVSGRVVVMDDATETDDPQ